MQAYPYRKVNWRPGANLKKPVQEARVAIVTAAGFRTPRQPPFDASVRGGDWSYRVLDANVDLATLRIAHRSDTFDARGLERTRIWRFHWTG